MMVDPMFMMNLSFFLTAVTPTANTVLFWENTMVFGANTVVFGANTMVFGVDMVVL